MSIANTTLNDDFSTRRTALRNIYARGRVIFMNGENLQKAIDAAKETQRSLADKLGVTANTVWRWRSGKQEPDDETKKKIAQFLGVPVAFLMEDPPPPLYPGTTEAVLPVFVASRSRSLSSIPIRQLPGGLFAVNNIVFVPKLPPEYTAHCGGSGLATAEITDPAIDYEVVAESKIGPIDPMHPPYAVTTDGSSMVDFGIPPNTTVVVNPAEHVEPGNLVLVEINGNPVIKKLYPRGENVRLLSSDGRELLVTKEDLDFEYVKICGKIIKADLELDHRP